ncbi:hypothetical protein HK096_007122 [Nowakowskiella sp. JEL0078]|nr:hypothetical protein HK096_007122 [Nowakowskiella sp. JEL0078]
MNGSKEVYFKDTNSCTIIGVDGKAKKVRLKDFGIFDELLKLEKNAKDQWVVFDKFFSETNFRDINVGSPESDSECDSEEAGYIEEVSFLSS